MEIGAALVELEVDLDVYSDRNGVSVFHGGLEAVVIDCIDCFLVEGRLKAFDDMHILRNAVQIDDESDDAYSLDLLFPPIVAVFGFGGGERDGTRDAVDAVKAIAQISSALRDAAEGEGCVLKWRLLQIKLLDGQGP